ncbi:MAG: hypothetical protein R2909_11775, partial [Gemmatimonadales bacterium]
MRNRYRRPRLSARLAVLRAALAGGLLVAGGLVAPVGAQAPDREYAKAPPLPDLTGKVALVTGST